MKSNVFCFVVDAITFGDARGRMDAAVSVMREREGVEVLVVRGREKLSVSFDGGLLLADLCWDSLALKYCAEYGVVLAASSWRVLTEMLQALKHPPIGLGVDWYDLPMVGEVVL